MRSGIFLSLGVSLALTLALEGGYAVLYGIRGKDFRLLLLANLLTNPVVVLCHHFAGRFWPEGLIFITAAMELWAVGTEGYLYHSRGSVNHPWRFAICANLISYTIGCIL